MDGQLVLDMAICEHIAYKNCEIKYNVVKIDEKETNLRQVLNIGHTIGRAVENISNYNLLHGEALAIGIVFQAVMGKNLGFLTEQDMNRVISLIKNVGINIELPKDITSDILKKNSIQIKRQERIKFALFFRMGSVE